MVSRSAGQDVGNQLGIIFRIGVAGNISDGKLLEWFLTARDGAEQLAFTELVTRHGPMVFGVCREVLGDPNDAQDAFQATFLVLARKAGSVRKADSVASWLHGVARRVAVRAKVEAARRRFYERRSAAMKPAETGRHEDSPGGWPELHAAIGRLPERYREPVVLCYLEGLSTEQAALRIGCPYGTILSRLSRARERLRRELERRSVTSSQALLMTRLRPPPMESLPAGLLDTTARAAAGFVAGQSDKTGLASAAATAAARGMLQSIAISKVKALGALALACGFALGGVWTIWQRDGLTRTARPLGAVERLRSELVEARQRNAEMQKALDETRAELRVRPAARRPVIATQVGAPLSDASKADSARAARQLADALKRHPARPSRVGGQIYMLDLVEGGITLIGAEPSPTLEFCGNPRWSNDGNRILFEAGTGVDWPRASLFAIEARSGQPVYTELGSGNSATFSPDDQSIAFLLHSGNEAGAGGGIWMMRADGSGRHAVGDFGAPFWSPDGREFLINSYSLPTTSSVTNLETREGGVVDVRGHQVFSWPSWAGPGTLVSALAPKENYDGDSIALLDVQDPADAKIVELLWKRSEGPDVTPRWPIYRPDTRRCLFVGEKQNRRTVYSVQRGESLRAKRLEMLDRALPQQNEFIVSITLSPDGRYLLFDAKRLTLR